MIDDASSPAWARFAEHDTTEENLMLLWAYLERYGRPLHFYTDRNSLFTVNCRAEGEEEAGEEAFTQIGLALRELEIGWIAARSPEVKGRIERFFDTAQDRLVKGLRVAGARTLEEARVYLEQEYTPLWNRRFVAEPAQPRREPVKGGGTRKERAKPELLLLCLDSAHAVLSGIRQQPFDTLSGGYI